MRLRRLLEGVLFAAAVAGNAGCTNPYTPAGHEGYVYERPRILGKGGFRGVVKGPGNYGVSLFRNEAVNIDIRPKTYTEQFKVLARDDLNVSFRVHAVLEISPGHVQAVGVACGGMAHPQFAPLRW